jgi:hypothetical protein
MLIVAGGDPGPIKAIADQIVPVTAQRDATRWM